MSSNPPSDGELTRRAQAGEVAALGLLLSRHEAGMRVVALSLLGYGPDADDAVQDAALVALRRIGDVREPESVGAWLRMVVRNACRMRLRTPPHAPFTEDLAPSVNGPEQVLDEHGMRDWIWCAMDELPAPHRQALMLRHFSGITSYEQIAAACEVPVGTIRSRLSDARAKMAQALRRTATWAHDDAAERTAASRREAVETLAAAERGAWAEVVAERWSPRVEMVSGQGRRGGREMLLAGMERDLEAGVRQRFRHAVASRDIVIWEMDLLSPPDDPEHCPPAVVWLMAVREGRFERLRLFHPSR